MSSPTDVIVICHFLEDEAVAKMQDWCAEQWNGQRFGHMPDEGADCLTGGSKFMSLAIYAMGGENADGDALADALAGFGWKYPHQVVLVSRYYDTDDDSLSLVRQYHQGKWWV